MRVQIIPSEKYKQLKEMWDIRLWKIYDVIKVEHDWYYIKVKIIFDCNSKGQETIIRMKSTEIKILN
jgi:hypothetical protein